MFYSVAAPVIFMLGIVNLVIGLLILLSCRCLPTARLTSGLMQYAAYKRFYKYHCYLWWVFWPSVVVHAILAIIFFGIPL